MSQVAQLLGAVPPWMDLGPPQHIDGIECHEVRGDWSHMAPCDRPPRYVAIGWKAPYLAPEYDRSAKRLPLQQKLPGKDIAQLKGLHRGAVAILFNGRSMADHDLSKIPVPIIGINRTYVGNPGYSGPSPDYLCVIDNHWLRIPEVLAHPRLINGSIYKLDVGYRATRSLRASPFSFDLAFDGYVCPAPCTTGHLALQLAVYLGFTRLYCLGFDLGGKHFDGSPGSSPHFSWAIDYHTRQAAFLAERRPDVQVLVCGSPDSRAPWPKVPFDALLSERAEVAA